MSFNLNIDETDNTRESYTKYQKPGIYENIMVEDVILGKSTVKMTPFIQLITKGINNEVGKSNKMYLSTEKSSPEKKMTGWQMTAKNLLDLIQATHNITREDAKEIELVPHNEPDIEKQYDALRANVLKLLKDKPFRGKFKGEKSGNGTIFATLDRVESMQVPKEATSLKFSAERDITNNGAYSSSPVVEANPFN